MRPSAVMMDINISSLFNRDLQFCQLVHAMPWADSAYVTTAPRFSIEGNSVHIGTPVPGQICPWLGSPGCDPPERIFRLSSEEAVDY